MVWVLTLNKRGRITFQRISLAFAFSSKRKKATTILEAIKDNEHGYDKRCHMKGASEIVINSCTKFLG